MPTSSSSSFPVEPPPVTSGLILWLTAEANVTKDAANLVSEWRDSLTGFLSAQAGAKPLWVADAFPGHPGIRFSGGESLFIMTSDMGQNNFTIIILGRATAPRMTGGDTHAGQRFLLCQNFTEGFPAVSVGSNGFGIYEFGATPALRAEAETDASVLCPLTIRYVNRAPAGYLGGNLVTQGEPSAGILCSIPHSIGGDGAGNGFVGDIAEILIYSGTFTEQNRLVIESWLQAKYDCYGKSSSSSDSSESSENSDGGGGGGDSSQSGESSDGGGGGGGEGSSDSSESNDSSSSESSDSSSSESSDSSNSETSDSSSSETSESSSSESTDSSSSEAPSSSSSSDSSGSSGLPSITVEPSDDEVATVDQDTIYFTAIVSGEDTEALLLDGAKIEWEVVSGGGSLDSTETTIDKGISTVGLAIGSADVGSFHKIKGRIKSLPSGTAVEDAPWVESGSIELFPGDPASITVTKDKDEIANDGTDEVEWEATVVDARGNPVTDGTAVGWELFGTDATWVSFDEETTDGKAKAVLRAPLIAGDIELEVSAGGEVIQTESLTCNLLEGTLSSNGSIIDLSGSGMTITASVNAVDGTPVYWFSTNGQITGGDTVQNGEATATLSTEDAELRGVVVTALAGGKLMVWEGEFAAPHNLFLGFADKLLVNGQESIEIQYPTEIGGSVTIPLKQSTELSLQANANSSYSITAPSYVSLSDDGVPMLGTPISGGNVVYSAQWSQGGRKNLGVMLDSSAPAEATLPITVSNGSESKTTNLKIADPNMVGLGATAIKALLGQGGNSATEQALSLLGGIVAGEIQDGVTVLSNFSKLIGTSEGEFNAAETMWAAGSLAASFIPGGFFAKRGLIAISKISGKLGKNSKLAKVLTSRFGKAQRLDPNLNAYEQSGELAFIEKISDDSSLLAKLDAPKADDAFVKRCVKIDQEIGDRFWDQIKSSDLTPTEVQKIVGVIGDGTPEAIQLLMDGGKIAANTLEKSVDGIQAALKNGCSQEALARVLNNGHLDTTGFNRVDLLSDLGAKGSDNVALASRVGMNKLVSRMGYKHDGAFGFATELRAAGHLQSIGYEIKVVGKRIPFSEKYIPKPSGNIPHDFNTDIDVVAIKDGITYPCNVKGSTSALNANAAKRQLENWLGAILKEYGTVEHVRIVVPSGAEASQAIQKVLTKHELQWDSVKISLPPSSP